MSVIKIKVVTSAKTPFFEKDIPRLLTILDRAKGAMFEISTSYKEMPPVVTRAYPDGDVKPDEEWMYGNFGQEDADVVIWHTTNTQKRNAKIKGINGTFYGKTGRLIYIACDDTKAKNYNFSEFTRLVLHEVGHYVSRQRETPDTIHHFDYNLKAIDAWYYTVDFTRHSLLLVLRNLARQYRAMLTTHTNPFEGMNVTQPFGVYNPHYKKTKHHIGTDFSTPLYTEIPAPVDCYITQTGVHKELGNWCIIRFKWLDGRIYHLRLLHLATMPKQGKFKRDDVVALSGNTGDSTGAHVHAEVWHIVPNVQKLTQDNFTKYVQDPVLFFN